MGYLVSHPIQYQAPMLRYLSGRPELELTVLFLTDLSVHEYLDPGFGRPVGWDVPLLDGYRHLFLRSLGRRDGLSFWRPFTLGLRRVLLEGRFDALWVHGYAHQANLRAVAAAKSLSIPILLRGESHLKSASRSTFRQWVKCRVLPGLFRAIDGFLAIGTLNRQYYLHYGVSEERIFPMPYAVDNDFFQSRAAWARPYRGSFRTQLGLEAGRPVILYASKLQRRKRPMDLLQAYQSLSPDGRREPVPYLLFIGDGEERPRLEERVRAFGWSSVKVLGFKNQTELPRYYDLADVFVLPSENEPWGLVVNEVMNAGKPVIVSDRVGCAPDLVEEGKNGFVVPVSDVRALADRLGTVMGNPGLARQMGEESYRRIAAWNFEADARGLIESLRTVVAGVGTRAS